MQDYEARLNRALDSAAAVFAVRGYHAASMRHVAQAAEMSIAGLYYYLPSKEEALFRICARIFDDLLDGAESARRSDSPADARLRAFARRHVGLVVSNRQVFRVLLQFEDGLRGDRLAQIRDRRRRYFAVAADLVREACPSADRAGTPRIATAALFGMLSWAPTWYRSDLDGSSGDVADELLDLFLRGARGGRALAEATT